MTNLMKAVHLTGHGDYDNLVYREDVPRPIPREDEVLIKVGAAAVNNTDINTRVGWYSKSATGDTASMTQDDNNGEEHAEDAAWGGSALSLPRIQGIDICGEIVDVGEAVSKDRIGQRVLVSPCIKSKDGSAARFVGSELDGGFAQYAAIPEKAVLEVQSEMSNEELASFPCSYTTAENMLERAKLSEGETVLITGASGGVGSATIQLAKRRGARVIAIAGESKKSDVMEAGATVFIPRGTDLIEALGIESVDVVIDVVGGPTWPSLLEVLKKGGRYAVAGAIAGPIVELDLRTLYLKDITLFGSTTLEDQVFPNLIRYIEKNEIKPLVSKIYPLKEIVQAQKDFLEKKHTGKLILVPEE